VTSHTVYKVSRNLGNQPARIRRCCARQPLRRRQRITSRCPDQLLIDLRRGLCGSRSWHPDARASESHQRTGVLKTTAVLRPRLSLYTYFSPWVHQEVINRPAICNSTLITHNTANRAAGADRIAAGSADANEQYSSSRRRNALGAAIIVGALGQLIATPQNTTNGRAGLQHLDEISTPFGDRLTTEVTVYEYYRKFNIVLPSNVANQ